MEKQILAAALASRSAFELITKLDADENLSPQAVVLFQNISNYYKNDDKAERVDRELLMQRLRRILPNPKHHTLFENLLGSLPETSPPNLLEELAALKRQAIGQRIVAAIGQNADQSEVEVLMEEYKNVSPEVLESGASSDIVRPDTPLEQVLAPMRSENLIQLLPRSLNERVDGGVLRGHHIGIFARPETGKTLHALNLIAGFLQQGLRVVYVGNEDTRESIIVRLVGRLTGATKAQVMESPSKAHARALERGYDKFLLAPLAPGTPFEVQKLVREWGADVVVIDQLTNLYLKGEGNNTERLGALARAARAIAKRENVLVVSLMQAGDSADEQLVLKMGDIDGSNTGIQAQLDLMIGIGHNEDFRKQGAQMFTLCKNKISGNHEHFSVFVDPVYGRVKGS